MPPLSPPPPKKIRNNAIPPERHKIKILAKLEHISMTLEIFKPLEWTVKVYPLN